MTYYQDIFEEAGNAIFRAETPDAIAAIRRPSCAATIWQRKPTTRFQSWIDALPPEQLPSARIVLRAEMVGAALLKLAEAHGTPEGPERDLLIEDVSALAAIFADVMRVKYVRLRLETVTGNACRKFHLDAVTGRLICTYRGPGTQYGTAVTGTAPHRIHAVPTGAPIVLRGTHWPEKPLSGLLHRSPPIEGTGRVRFVLVLDPVDDPAQATNTRFMH
ncbi:DUF1826 domain-containing protein [Mameliella sp.]|uniref:DUF1826 domain-containing protein n=1 Tax=Mameliella sp. TaxID=1924940 RepID=UPI003BABCA45